jgi:HK97 family phage portal protein
MLGGLFRRNDSEERSISFQTIFASGDSLALTTNSGVTMNQDEALKLGTVYACVRLIADSISTLPIDTFRRSGDERVNYPRPVWLDSPELGMSRTTHFSQVLISLLMNGNAFIRILRDDQGIAGLVVLNPRKVEVQRNNVTRRVEYSVDNGREIVPHDEMMHLTELLLPGELRGRSRIDLIRDTLGLGRALDTFAQLFFGQGSTLGGIIEFPGNLTREQAKDLADSFEEQHRSVRRSHRPGVLFGGAKYSQTSAAPNEAQMLESRQYSTEEIARTFRCPPALLGVTTPGAMSYASVEMNGIHFVTYCLRPYIVKIEDAYSNLIPGDAFLKINVDGLLRGDQATRYASFSTGIQSGFLSINDIHRLEDMPPADGGDVYRVPLANVDLAAANLTELEKKTSIAVKLVQAGFDPSATLVSLGLDALPHTGLPSVQLQNIAQVEPEDPAAAYPVAS